MFCLIALELLQDQVWVVLIGDALKEQYVYLKSRILKT